LRLARLRLARSRVPTAREAHELPRLPRQVSRFSEKWSVQFALAAKQACGSFASAIAS